MGYHADLDDKDILEVLRRREKLGLSTTEVQERVGYDTRATVHYRLERLEEDGRVRSQKIGDVRVWFLPTEWLITPYRTIVWAETDKAPEK